MHALCPTIPNRTLTRHVLMTHPPAILRRPTSARASEVEQRYGWDVERDRTKVEGVRELKVSEIRRPLARTRQNDAAKVEALMESIERHGLKEPIDVLEVAGNIYGFSGCHRYEAFQRLGRETILCRVRKANQSTLRMHMM
jgi:sulfiredoxin